MNKLLKLVGVALLVATIFGCETEDSTEYAKVGDTFKVARTYDGTSTLFDYTGLGLDDRSQVEISALYKDASDKILISVEIMFDYDGPNAPMWVFDNEFLEDGNDRRFYNVVADVYKQWISDNPNAWCVINFDIDDIATKTIIVVNDELNGKKYHFEGNHNGNGFVKLVKIED